ncbi:hypothetical protein PENTCL1PPCAC_15911 [Pristionchus entomophagus]|uniref:G protein-coupled receptor n=1 Tax=Pristionchus entomophagus TaxID=358040 RepID=A0AAV5THR3_9BILA|nr:hypothetical protein PENTCL1PPCAC_15911 [Pristionchus entomophagus]
MLTFIAFAVFATWYTTCLFFYVATDEARADLAPEFEQKYGIDAMTHPIVMADYWRDGHYNIRPLVGLCIFLTIVSTGLGIMTFCTVSILRYLSRAESLLSTKTRQLQYALFRSLAVQTIIPVIFLHANCALAIGLPVFGIDFSLFCDFISVSCSCFPPFDAVATILLMRDYRKAVRSIVMCSYCTGGFSVLINGFFLFLIVFNSPASLTRYKVLLGNSAATDLVFSLSTTFLQCRLIPNKWAFAYVALGPAKYFGEQVSYYTYVLQLHSLFYLFLCFPVIISLRVDNGYC